MGSTQKINTIHYVFANRQPQVMALIKSWGLKPAKTERGLWRQINDVIRKYPDQALMGLANIHPDRDLILSTIKNVEPINPAIITPVTPEAIKEVVKEETKSNACGCMGGRSSGCDGSSTCNCGKQSNAEGEKQPAPVKAITPETASVVVPANAGQEMMSMMPILMIGLVVTAVAFMAINSRKA